jgi:hypothetical protein
MYKPILRERWFNAEQHYSDVDWTCFTAVVDAFSLRLRRWYVDPAEALVTHGHFGFPVVALSSILIDTLSQYESGKQFSSRKIFIDFVERRMPAFAGKLPNPIRALVPTRKGPKEARLKTVPQVLYAGFRCGVVHEAHIPLYGAIHGENQPFEIHAKGFAEYANGTPCPTVVINPKLLLDATTAAYRGYVAELRNDTAKDESLRKQFAKKIQLSFGLAITP